MSIGGSIVQSNYFPITKKGISLSSASGNSKDLSYDFLNLSKDKIPFINFNNEASKIYIPDGFTSQGSDKRELTFSPEKDIIHISRNDISIFIQKAHNLHHIQKAPFFVQDRNFQKLAAKTVSAVIGVLLLLLLVDTSLPEKETKKVAIIYKMQKKVKKRMKSNDPKNNNSNPGQNSQNAPIKQNIAKKIKIIKKQKITKSKPKKQMQKKKMAPTQKIVKAKPIKAYKFKSSKTYKSYFKKSKMVSKVTNKNSKSSKSNFTGVKVSTSSISKNSNFAKRSLSSISRKGSLNSLGGQGLISKEGIDTSYSNPKTVVLGSMDPELLRKILREYLPQFRHCYQEELTAVNSNLNGVISLDFRINRSGKVSNSKVSIRKAKFSRSGINCMNKVLSLIKFPKPKGGGYVDVRQPLNFYSEREVIN